jgi:DOPA 4,5-dioxygenase
MYHAHVYFPLREQDKAQALNEIIRQERQDVLRVFPLVGRLVGPHKMPMFEIHLESLSEEELLDHTERAIWLGREIGVFEEKLEK